MRLWCWHAWNTGRPAVAVTGLLWGALVSFLPCLPIEAREIATPSAITEIVAQRCAGCHGGDEPKGGLLLTSDPGNPGSLDQTDLLWKVYNAVRRGKMPPAEAETLPEQKKAKFLGIVLSEFGRRATLGPSETESARRLTNFEYQNTLSDLVGFDVNVIEDLPKDPVAPYQFNNTAEFMRIGPEQIDRYLEIARRVMASAIVDSDRPEVHKTRSEWQPHGADRGMGADEVGIWGNRRNTPASGMGLRSFPKTGEFLIRFQASAILPPGISEIPLRLVMGYNLNVNSSTQQIRPVGTVTLRNSPDDPQVFEFRGRIENFPAEPGRVVNGKRRPDGMTITFQNLYDDGTLNDDPVFLTPRNLAMPRVVVNWAEFEAPVADRWPPPHHTRILFASPLRESDTEEYVRQVLQRFMSRAFRRPAMEEEIATFLEIYKIVRPQLPSLEAAVRETLAMVLVSPQFMYVTRPIGGRYHQYALASRLSYFLWGTMPDEELLKCAEQSTLDDDSVIAAQVLRLLSDEGRTRQSLRNLTVQWLSLQKLATVPVNRELFPRFLYYVARGERAGTEVPYRPTIRDYMVDESVAFIHELIRGNEKMLSIVDSQFAMLNQPLAAHYGMPKIQGHELRRVSLPESSRLGGLLSQGSMLVANGTGSAPHPIYRAVWLREAILGDDVPEPPADVPALSDTAGESADTALTIGRLLELHRQKESCRNCHAGLDPWGIPFEKYNAIGRFQPSVPKEGTRVAMYSTNVHGDLAGYQQYLDSINTEAVEARAVLPTGAEIDGLEQLKKYLMENHSDEIAENVIRRFISYGLGRQLDWRDQIEVERLVDQAKQQEFRFRDAIVLICQSRLFRNVQEVQEKSE